MSVNTVIMGKSIFRRFVYLKVRGVEIGFARRSFCSGVSETHELEPSYKLEFIKGDTIYTVRIPNSLPIVGEDIFSKETNEILKIKKVVRTNLNNVPYIVKYQIVEDCQSELRMEEASEDKYKQIFIEQEMTSELKDIIRKLKDKCHDSNKLRGKVYEHNSRRFKIDKIELDDLL